MDKVSAAQRSRNMASVRTRDTEPERVVRSTLHSMGLRFRLNQRSLPGTPDVVLRRHGTAIFVHGCFWHGHTCQRGLAPASNREFWLPKLERNRLRDRRQARMLRAAGWRVITIWECQTKNTGKLRRRLESYFKDRGSAAS